MRSSGLSRRELLAAGGGAYAALEEQGTADRRAAVAETLRRRDWDGIAARIDELLRQAVAASISGDAARAA